MKEKNNMNKLKVGVYSIAALMLISIAIAGVPGNTTTATTENEDPEDPPTHETEWNCAKKYPNKPEKCRDCCMQYGIDAELDCIKAGGTSEYCANHAEEERVACKAGCPGAKEKTSGFLYENGFLPSYEIVEITSH